MKNRDRIQARFLKDALPVRLAGLAADLARVASSARRETGGEAVASTTTAVSQARRPRSRQPSRGRPPATDFSLRRQASPLWQRFQPPGDMKCGCSTGLLEESQYFIEWIAAEAPVEVAADLVDLQIMLALWRRAWPEAQQHRQQRSLQAVQAKQWSDRVLDWAG